MHLKMNSPAVAHHGRTVIGFNWIGGRELEGDLPSFDAKSAVDSRDTVGIFPECGERDVEKAARAAAAALRTWSALPLCERAAAIGRIGEALASHKEKLAAVITREVGKPAREALAEVQETIDLCRFFHGEGTAQAGPDRPGHRRPLGVVAIMAGNSSPLAAPCWKLIPALLYGNTVVWKPSVNAPTTAYLLVRCMMDAGLAPGAVNVVNGKGRAGCGKFFVAGIDKGFYQKFSFTGSTAMGRIIGEMAGRNLMVPSLELGGKNPMIIMPDCDLERAVRAAVDGAFGCAGQSRGALANLILHRDVAAPFKAQFLAAVAALEVGNPVTDPDVFYGPMINARFAKSFEEHWAMGLEDGAGLLCGGARWTEDNRTGRVRGLVAKGFYMQACVWDGVTPEMRLFQTEVFGPTVNLSTVDSFDQALAYANGTPYGLAGALHSENREWIGRFERESSAALVSINGAGGAQAHLPFGGTGWSGNGTLEPGLRMEERFTRWHAVYKHAGAGPGCAPSQYEPSNWDGL